MRAKHFIIVFLAISIYFIYFTAPEPDLRQKRNKLQMQAVEHFLEDHPDIKKKLDRHLPQALFENLRVPGLILFRIDDINAEIIDRSKTKKTEADLFKLEFYGEGKQLTVLTFFHEEDLNVKEENEVYLGYGVRGSLVDDGHHVSVRWYMDHTVYKLIVDYPPSQEVFETTNVLQIAETMVRY